MRLSPLGTGSRVQPGWVFHRRQRGYELHAAPSARAGFNARHAAGQDQIADNAIDNAPLAMMKAGPRITKPAD